MEKTETLPTALERSQKATFIGGRWLAESGIQESCSELKFRGGVYAWFDLRSESYPFIYSEITGYAINSFLFLNQLTNDRIYLESAISAGEWALKTRDSNFGLIANRIYRGQNHQPYYKDWVFTFDQWMVISGLASLHSVTKNSSYLSAAEEMAALLFDKTFRKDGSMYPVFNLSKGQPEETNDRWSRQVGSFHAKSILGLLQLFDITGQKDYFSRAKKMTEFALTQQDRGGRFVTQTNNQSTHLHPHSYTIEGLLPLALREKDSTLIDACNRAVEWSLNSFEKRLPCFFNGSHFLPFERVDVLAQTLRLASILSQQKLLLNSGALNQIAEKLMNYQITNGTQQGGFFYGQEENGNVHYHINAWVTMFAVQALWIYSQRYNSNDPYRFNFFV